MNPLLNNHLEVAQIINIFIDMIVGSALVYDLYFKKIPNYLLLTGYAGIAPFMYVRYGTGGLIDAVAAVFLSFAVLAVIYMVGGLGAGDVKLMCMLAGYLRLENAVKYILLVIFIGAFAGIIKMLSNYSVRICDGKSRLQMKKRRTVIRFSIPITVGYMVVLFSKGGIV